MELVMETTLPKVRYNAFIPKEIDGNGKRIPGTEMPSDDYPFHGSFLQLGLKNGNSIAIIKRADNGVVVCIPPEDVMFVDDYCTDIHNIPFKLNNDLPNQTYTFIDNNLHFINLINHVKQFLKSKIESEISEDREFVDFIMKLLIGENWKEFINAFEDFEKMFDQYK